MFVLKIVLTLLSIRKGATSDDILLPKAVGDSCLSKILGEITKDDKFLAIGWSHRHGVDDSLIDEIWELSKEKMKFIIMNSDGRLQTVNKINGTSGTVLLASTTGDIVDGISSIRGANAWSWSIMTKFIILNLDSSGYGRATLTDQFVKDIFHTFASLNARNVHFIYEFGKEFTSKFTMFSYKDTSCGEVVPVAESEYALHKVLRAHNFESECTIKAAVPSYEPYSKDKGFTKGIEINLVKELALWAHSDVEFEAVVHPELKDNSFDIIIGASNRMKDKLSRSVDFDFDDLTWCVKKADLHPHWRSSFFIGTWEAWTIAAVGVYSTAATLYVFFHYYHHPENFHYCTGLAVVCFLSIPVPYNPTHGIARIHFGFILIYGLLATILVNSFLISVLTKPKHQYQIQTVDELMKYNFKILIDEEILSLNQLGDDEVSTYTKQNYERCNGVIECLSQLLERSNVAAIVPRKLAKHFESKLNTPIFCFDHSEAFNRVTRTVTLGASNSRLLNRTNSFIRLAMETGHLLKWETDSAARKKYEDHRNGPIILTVEHISAVVLMYVGGMAIALLMFIGEWFTFKNIQKGDAAGGGWKFLDKYIFSTDRIYWKPSSKSRDSPF